MKLVINTIIIGIVFFGIHLFLTYVLHVKPIISTSQRAPWMYATGGVFPIPVSSISMILMVKGVKGVKGTKDDKRKNN